MVDSHSNTHSFVRQRGPTLASWTISLLPQLDYWTPHIRRWLSALCLPWSTYSQAIPVTQSRPLFCSNSLALLLLSKQWAASRKKGRERERETQFSTGGLEEEGANSVGFWTQESSFSFSSALHRTDAVNYNCSQIPDLPELNSQTPISAAGDQQPPRKSGRCLLDMWEGLGRSRVWAEAKRGYGNVDYRWLSYSPQHICVNQRTSWCNLQSIHSRVTCHHRLKGLNWGIWTAVAPAFGEQVLMTISGRKLSLQKTCDVMEMSEKLITVNVYCTSSSCLTVEMVWKWIEKCCRSIQTVVKNQGISKNLWDRFLYFLYLDQWFSNGLISQSRF